jgi:hypothetical protein
MTRKWLCSRTDTMSNIKLHSSMFCPKRTLQSAHIWLDNGSREQYSRECVSLHSWLAQRNTNIWNFANKTGNIWNAKITCRGVTNKVSTFLLVNLSVQDRIKKKSPIYNTASILNFSILASMSIILTFNIKPNSSQRQGLLLYWPVWFSIGKRVQQPPPSPLS